MSKLFIRFVLWTLVFVFVLLGLCFVGSFLWPVFCIGAPLTVAFFVIRAVLRRRRNRSQAPTDHYATPAPTVWDVPTATPTAPADTAPAAPTTVWDVPAADQEV